MKDILCLKQVVSEISFSFDKFSVSFRYLYSTVALIYILDMFDIRCWVLRLSISSPQGFYNKMTTSELKFDEDLMK